MKLHAKNRATRRRHLQTVMAMLSLLFYLCSPDQSGVLFSQESDNADKDLRTGQPAASANIVRPIPVYFQPSMFRGEGGKTRIVMALGIPHAALEFQRSMFGKGKCPLNLSIEARGATGATASGPLTRQVVVWTGMMPPDLRGYFLSEEVLEADPGETILSAQISTLDERRFGKREGPISVPDFSGDSLMISSIQPAYRIDDPGSEFADKQSSRLTIVPYPFNRFVRNYPVFAYFEIYNLKQDGAGSGRYAIDYRIYELRESVSIFSRIAGQGKRKLVHENTLSRTAQSGQNGDYFSFDPEMLQPASYLLTVTITDEIAKRSAESALLFELISEPTQLLP